MYEFRDITEVSEGTALPSEAMQINGEYIENIIPGYRTLHVSGREALSPEVDFFDTGIRDGSKIKSKRYPARTITVKYQIIAGSNEEFRDAYNKLASILDCENAELIFNDEPDKYFTGTPVSIGDVEPGSNSVTGEIQFLCVDPFKYSIVEYEAEPLLDESSVLIDYNGTYKSFPILEADFFTESEASEDGETVSALTGSGDCGYVAFFNENEKIIQLGDPEEKDGENAFAKSQTLANNSFKKTTDWGTAAKSQWAVNSGIVTDSSAMSQTGSVGMGVASYTAATKPADTSATLLTVTSKAAAPNVDYKVSAKATGRTANSVKLTFAITGSLAKSSNYFLSGYILNASVYVGGAWHTAVLKRSSDKWRGKTGHTVNISVTVSGLSASDTSISGIKFKVTRGGSNGSAGKLSETACKNMPISAFTTPQPETYYLTPSSYGSGNKWHGPSITRVLPADASGETGAKNFTLSYSQKLSIGNGKADTNQLGAFQVLAVSGSGSSRKIVAGVNIYKGGSGKTANLRFYINGAVVKTESIDISYNNAYFKPEKTSTITKSGQTVTFNICGIKRTFTDSNITDIAVTQIIFTMSKWGSYAALSYNGIYNVKFVKNNCTTWRDIPNKFSTGDIVEADCKDGEIYLNGVKTPNLGALGNDWEEFYLSPGLNQIGFSYSDWVASGYEPSIKIRYREVFL